MGENSLEWKSQVNVPYPLHTYLYLCIYQYRYVSLPAVARASASRHRSYHSYAYRNTCFRLRLLPKHVLVARTYLVIQVSSRLPIIISNNVGRHHDVIVALKLRIPARASRYS
jgi:hypothetical protein